MEGSLEVRFKDQKSEEEKTNGADDRHRSQSGDAPKCDVKSLCNKGRFRHSSGECLRNMSGDRHRHTSGDSGRARNQSGESIGSNSPSNFGPGSKVMIALDDSHHSAETIQYYLRHVHRPENEVILAHVIELPENAHEAMKSMLSRETIAEMWSQGVTKAEQIEKQYATILQEAGVAHIHIRNESGLKPGHALCQVAEQESVDMIVIGSRGEGKLRRTLLGSVSDYIVHHAHCPALVCKYQKTKHSKHGKQKKHDKDDKEK